MDAKALNVLPGAAHPLGATLTANGCNFAVHCPNATEVQLCLFAKDTEEQLAVIPLPAKTGKVWHGFIEGITEGQLYGYRTCGENNAQLGLQFNPEKLLIDPYAKALNRPLVWNAQQYHGDSQFMIAKGLVLKTSECRGRITKPRVPMSQTVLYEAHVKGISQLHPDVPDAHRGKFLGLSHPSIIKHIKSLGVTSVQLMPVMAFMPERYITEKGLTNYWGYNPINYFSPDPRYVVADGVCEFKSMVDSLHEAGLEVILDVVFNHTAEGGLDGPTLAFKGLDNASFYLFERNEYGTVDYRKYVNNSGCGNSVNTAYPYVLKLVMDSLRYWVQEMGVDGFRFDLAASLGRDPYEFSSVSGFFRAIRQDPVLLNIKLIAEPWDIGNGGYRLGQFPSNWVECNDKYRDTVRAFWRGDKGHTSDFATRLLGSRDIFPKENRAIHTSVNMVTYHDGFTLQDLVSYNERHNEANLEQNRDGHGHNISSNHGFEGVTGDTQIKALRDRQKRNLFATLMMSQGIPHVLGGDELSRTQQGNNNAYCQDNEINWFDWELRENEQDFLDFCRHMIKLRRDSELLSQLNLEDDSYSLQHNVDKINWYRPDGERKLVDDWHDHNNQAFAVEFVGLEPADTVNKTEHWLLVFNATDHDVRFNLPLLSQAHGWKIMVDTRYPKLALQPQVAVKQVYMQAFKSICLFKVINDQT